ncbi:hypothetical protein [Kitasatospora cathayae]|uniref:Uncharacterized protein n=1 Tax=Kitasatospora cathayae TaxID=3004092 RepID=A0ABY7Q5G4_9ACTN|nr:hypothetical protein [Kitasatospora sp. HUAS 3-15]WBP87958.1 hypothetical protein O1G21_20340 [Kitasatospora sp. HUAS 3-15]
MQSGGAELNLGRSDGFRSGAPVAPDWWPVLAPDVTVDQLDAAEHCEMLLRDTMAAVRPTTVWQETVPRAGVRLSAPGRRGPEVLWYVTRGRDLLTVVSPGRRPELARMVERQWRWRGWTITSLNAGRDRPGVAATSRCGSQLVLCFGEFGEVRLTASLLGVAGSDRVPALPGAGEPDPAPLPWVHCSYWSAPV